MLEKTQLRLILLLGKTIPLPVPLEIMNSLSKVEVTNDSDSGDGFQLTFMMSKTKLIEYNLLASGSVDPFTRVKIIVLLGVLPSVLMDGIITHHQINPNGDQGNPTLTVSGKDITIMMDLKEVNKPYKNYSDSMIVADILKNYAEYNLLPVIKPTTDVKIETEGVNQQQDTDFKYIQKLAERNGFVFYIEPVAPALNKAYWGPAVRQGIQQPALTLNMGSYTNLSSINFSFDSLAPVGTESTFIEPFSKRQIPVVTPQSLKFPPLSLFPAQPRKTVILRDSGNKDQADAAKNALAAVTNSPDAVSGDGEVDTIKYGHILRARNLVGVRGVGFSYDGLYYLKKVTHSISQGVYKQQFSITREGHGPLSPILAI